MDIKDLLGDYEKIIEGDKREKKKIIQYLKQFDDFYRLANIQKIEVEEYLGMFSGTQYSYHYIVELHGGNNGNSDWQGYFKRLSDIFAEDRFKAAGIDRMWLIKLSNNCPRDTHVVYAGIGLE